LTVASRWAGSHAEYRDRNAASHAGGSAARSGVAKQRHDDQYSNDATTHARNLSGYLRGKEAGGCTFSAGAGVTSIEPCQVGCIGRRVIPVETAVCGKRLRPLFKREPGAYPLYSCATGNGLLGDSTAAMKKK